MQVALFWLIVFVFALLVESMTVSFYLFWYAPAALLALYLNHRGISFSYQCTVFVLLANILFAVYYFFIKKKNIPRPSFPIGETALLLKKENETPEIWRVLVKRQEWLAVRKDTQEIWEKDQKREVLFIEGNKLFLK